MIVRNLYLLTERSTDLTVLFRPDPIIPAPLKSEERIFAEQMWRTGEKTVLLDVDGVLAVLRDGGFCSGPLHWGRALLPCKWRSAGRSALDVVPRPAAAATQSAMLARCSNQCLRGAVRGQGQCTRSRNVVTASGAVSDGRRRLRCLWWFWWMVLCDAVARPPGWRCELGIFLAV
jgi:hypothetical protein